MWAMPDEVMVASSLGPLVGSKRFACLKVCNFLEFCNGSRNGFKQAKECSKIPERLHTLMHALVSHSRRNWLYGLCCFVCAKGCEGLPQSMICSTCAVRMAACNMRMHEILTVEWCIESLNVVVTLSLRSKWIQQKTRPLNARRC